MAAPTRAFVNQYSTTVQFILQQVISAAEDKVTKETLKGEYGYFDFEGKATLEQKTGRHVKKTFVDTAMTRRRIHSDVFYHYELLDKDDQRRMMADPKSALMDAIKGAAKTKIDQLIIAAGRGTAYTGKTGSTPVVLPSTQKIVHGSVGFTVAKMEEVLLKFQVAEVPQEWPKYQFISPYDFRDLLEEVEYGSADYNRLMPLMSGEVVPFLGINLIVTNLLTTASYITYGMAWVPQGIALAVAQEITTKLFENLDYVTNPWEFDIEMDLGASRMQEECVIEVQTYRT